MHPRPSAAMIRVRGARVHNLKNIDADIPRGLIVALTGVSGSGKSSLAFDTIHAEGRRRFIESLSGPARAMFERVESPDVDMITGLPPTVALEQKHGLPSPRSTVATLSEIHDYLRLLYARTGTPHCPSCGGPIRRQPPEQIASTILALPEGRKVILLAPMAREKKGQSAEVFATIRREGLIRARIDGEIVDVGDAPPPLVKRKRHTIEAVIDRLVIRPGIRPRLAESLDRALRLGDGAVVVSTESEGGVWLDETLSSKFACPNCGINIAEIEPRTFSFNSPRGACPECQGLGAVGEELAIACAACGGARLRPEARAVTLNGLAIHELCLMLLPDANRFIQSLSFAPPLDLVGPPLVEQISSRLQALERIGLDYLSLSRSTDTLSGGELQRVRLAGQLGGGLIGVAYILDEPTSGMHPSDTDRLLDCIRSLKDSGSSVLIVEHDEAVILASDWVIDLGPGAGPDGGRIVAEGLANSLDGPDSITARWLRGELIRDAGDARSDRLQRSRGAITIVGASAHNLRELTASIPLGSLTCVSGVSGSGKSSLILDVLARAVHRKLWRSGPEPGRHERIDGLDAIDSLVVVDQAPIGRTPRSTPATFTGVFDEIRKVFARTREAKVRGYKSSRFSFNARGGRCDACRGWGWSALNTRLLPDVLIRCAECQGRRFNDATLDVRFKGKSIADVLELRVDAALRVFEHVPKVRRGLEALHDAGLGYLTLGQPSTTLSGGEAQRVRLAAELGRATTGKALYVLDEPTTGLHAADVVRLMSVLTSLADRGDTLVVIEHNLDVLRQADWLIDLGPGGGPNGGRVVAMGAPADVAKAAKSVTARFL